MKDDTQPDGGTIEPVPRVCAREGCPGSIEGYHGNARYCSGRCRSAAYKERTGYRLVAVRNPPQTRKSQRRPRAGGPRGLTLPWRRAVTVLAEYLQADGHSADEAAEMTREAERILAAALSDKQRERLQPAECSTGRSTVRGGEVARVSLPDATREQREGRRTR